MNIKEKFKVRDSSYITNKNTEETVRFLKQSLKQVLYDTLPNTERPNRNRKDFIDELTSNNKKNGIPKIKLSNHLCKTLNNFKTTKDKQLIDTFDSTNNVLKPSNKKNKYDCDLCNMNTLHSPFKNEPVREKYSKIFGYLKTHSSKKELNKLIDIDNLNNKETSSSKITTDYKINKNIRKHSSNKVKDKHDILFENSLSNSISNSVNSSIKALDKVVKYKDATPKITIPVSQASNTPQANIKTKTHFDTELKTTKFSIDKSNIIKSLFSTSKNLNTTNINSSSHQRPISSLNKAERDKMKQSTVKLKSNMKLSNKILIINKEDKKSTENDDFSIKRHENKHVTENVKSRKELQFLIKEKAEKIESESSKFLSKIEKNNKLLKSSTKLFSRSSSIKKQQNFKNITNLNKFLFNNFAVKSAKGHEDLYNKFTHRLNKSSKEDSKKFFTSTANAYGEINEKKKDRIKRISNKLIAKISSKLKGHKKTHSYKRTTSIVERLEKERKVKEKVENALNLINMMHYNNYDDWERRDKKPMEYYNLHNLKRISQVRKIFKTLNDNYDNYDFDLDEIKSKKREIEKMQEQQAKNRIIPRVVKMSFKKQTVLKYKGLNGINFGI